MTHGSPLPTAAGFFIRLGGSLALRGGPWRALITDNSAPLGPPSTGSVKMTQGPMACPGVQGRFQLNRLREHSEPDAGPRIHSRFENGPSGLNRSPAHSTNQTHAAAASWPSGFVGNDRADAHATTNEHQIRDDAGACLCLEVISPQNGGAMASVCRFASLGGQQAAEQECSGYGWRRTTTAEQ